MNLRTLFVGGLFFGLVTMLPAAESVDQQPVPTFQKRPSYPFSLRVSGNSGEVLIEFIVDDHGEVRNPVVLKSTHPEFEAPAVEALLEWKFKPGKKAGRPVPTRMQVPIVFQLDAGDGIDRGVAAFTVPRKPSKNLPPEFQYDEPPQPTLTSAPVYPFGLLEKKIKGSATIGFAVDPEGRTRKITVQEASQPEFGAAAAAMIAVWRFVPAKKDGKASWSLLSRKQVFDRDDRDTPVNESASRLLAALKKDPSPILAGLGALDARPKARYQPGPLLPESMAKHETPERAEIEFIIDRAGHAQLPRVVSASREDFAWAAATAVARWQFSPPTKEGKPVDVRVTVPIIFTPPKPDAPAATP